MAPVTNGRFIYNEIATGYPIPGKTTIHDTSQIIDLEKTPLNGGTLVKVMYLAMDPFLRFRMRDPKIDKHFPQFTLGEPVQAFGIGVVIRSENSEYKAGDHVYAILPAVEYFLAPKDFKFRVIHNEHNVPWSLYVGVLGMPGSTAYAAWKKYTHAKKGDTVFVTTAAGAVGATVVQLAKMEGLRVIASAGSKSKVDFVKSLGADVVFNYKEESTHEILQREGPIDIYWDHVGGEVFDAVLENIRPTGTIIVCGSMPSYNGAPNPIYRHALIFERDVTIYGFRSFMIWDPYLDEFYTEMPKLVASGRMKYLEHVTKGLENAGQVLLEVQMGRNEGKRVIEVAGDH